MTEQPHVSMIRKMLIGLERMVIVLVRLIQPPIRLIEYCIENYSPQILTRANVVGVLIVLTIWFYFSGIDINAYIFGSDVKEAVKRSEIIRNYGLIIAAFVAGVLAVWRSSINHRQAKIAEKGLSTERFTKATELLGNKDRSARMGGIYALWQLAEESPQDIKIAVWETLSAYARIPPPLTDVEEGNTLAKRILRADVAVIIKLLGTNEASKNLYRAEFKLNLFGIDLGRGNLTDVNLARAMLGGANLAETGLHNANLSDAYLGNAILGMATHLTQDQLDSVRPSRPPISLPEGLQWPFEEIYGTWKKRDRSRST